MTQGIYCYIDKKTNEIVYIGKDSYINERRRDKQHYQKSSFEVQVINRVLQNNPNRYKYKILKEGDFSNKNLTNLEIFLIQKHNPKFNYTEGGEGTKGFNHSKKTIEKIRKSNLGKYHPPHTEETKKRISINNAKYWKGKNIPMSQKIALSKKNNKSGYFRVGFQKNQNRWRYRYYEKGSPKSIVSIDIKDLEKKVKEKGLPWFKLDEV